MTLHIFPTSDKAFFHGIHFDTKSDKNILVINEDKEFTTDNNPLI